MLTCSHCGQQNAEGTFVCRYCGAGLSRQPRAAHAPDYVPPHAAWSDQQPQPFAQVQPFPATPQPAGFRCPYCQSTYPPRIGSRISNDGWLVFALLLLFCAPLFWIGLLMKEEYRMCVNCGSKFG
ncbi:MAG: LITAF-like zinc ribbon domain-containing protein [Acidobacteria bacterium]|nr:LITAF-like zinc ribbon domain-containing protein [Acidobacteriota bacterium]